jgi:N6-adenosine-specific RNA methylase IME4
MMKKYNIILCDAPWSYTDKANAGKRGASHKYSVMSIDDIKALPVNDIAADDCILFMWATFPMIQEALDTIKSWKFKYKTAGFVWIKKNKKSNTNFMGMGNWTRANSEVCLIAIKGKPKRISASVRQVIESVIESHSKKPDIIRDKIVELMGDLPRIELFARQQTPGWDAVGNAISGMDIRQEILLL